MREYQETSCEEKKGANNQSRSLLSLFGCWSPQQKLSKKPTMWCRRMSKQQSALTFTRPFLPIRSKDLRKRCSQVHPLCAKTTPTPDGRPNQSDGQNPMSGPPNDPGPQQRTHKTSNVDSISLVVLPALISNGKKKNLKVNVMLDPCSISSYITEAVANELQLNGQPLNLTIDGTGGTEV